MFGQVQWSRQLSLTTGTSRVSESSGSCDETLHWCTLHTPPSHFLCLQPEADTLCVIDFQDLPSCDDASRSRIVTQEVHLSNEWYFNRTSFFFFHRCCIIYRRIQMMRLPPIFLSCNGHLVGEPEHKTPQTIIDFALHLTFMILTNHPTVPPSKWSKYSFIGSSAVAVLVMIWLFCFCSGIPAWDWQH